VAYLNLAQIILDLIKVLLLDEYALFTPSGNLKVTLALVGYPKPRARRAAGRVGRAESERGLMLSLLDAMRGRTLLEVGGVVAGGAG
jgi:hypothetical protein